MVTYGGCCGVLAGRHHDRGRDPSSSLPATSRDGPASPQWKRVINGSGLRLVVKWVQNSLRLGSRIVLKWVIFSQSVLLHPFGRTLNMMYLTAGTAVLAKRVKLVKTGKTGVKLAISGFKLAISGFKLAISGYNWAISGYNWAISGYNWAISGYNLAISGVIWPYLVKSGHIWCNLAISGLNRAISGYNWPYPG